MRILHKFWKVKEQVYSDVTNSKCSFIKYMRHDYVVTANVRLG